MHTADELSARQLLDRATDLVDHAGTSRLTNRQAEAMADAIEHGVELYADPLLEYVPD
ncbi:hypothetical protein L2K70_09780 [Nocardioides KLBMP 9356]|uniref:Uncharacterized protein n=1 Tax=Nocardioides potassii TaxID=2911371 RepID=A0ABS9H9J7_9ACTN|nr:hypothetical protein [Nocardioides potassii]MCF6377895.1 hypothetical protein [Nocardioides potassii]